MTPLSTLALDQIVEQARTGGRRRMHRNLHGSYSDPCQRFFNAIWRDSYIPPHRHSHATDEETLIAVRGAFAAILFTSEGRIDTVVECGEGRSHVGTIVAVGQWHSVVALTEVVVILEIKAGPFDPDRAKEFASWAPPENSPDGPAYLAGMRDAATAFPYERFPRQEPAEACIG
jgi:cupin fold WbuC family metalloprotein